MRNDDTLQSAESLAKYVGMQEFAIFRQTPANLRLRKHACKKINFAPKFPQIPAPNFPFLEENFPTTRNLFVRMKFRGRGRC